MITKILYLYWGITGLCPTDKSSVWMIVDQQMDLYSKQFAQ